MLGSQRRRSIRQPFSMMERFILFIVLLEILIIQFLDTLRAEMAPQFKKVFLDLFTIISLVEIKINQFLQFLIVRAEGGDAVAKILVLHFSATRFTFWINVGIGKNQF